MSDRGLTPTDPVPSHNVASSEPRRSDNSERHRRKRRRSSSDRSRTRDRHRRRRRHDSRSSRTYSTSSTSRSRSRARVRRSRVDSPQPRVTRSRSRSRRWRTERKSRIEGESPSMRKTHSRSFDERRRDRRNTGARSLRSPSRPERAEEHHAPSNNTGSGHAHCNKNNNSSDVTSISILDKLVNILQNGSIRGNAPHVQGSQNIITEYDPNMKSQTMKDWIRKINESAEVYGWSEQQIIFYSLPKLKGLAKKWYDGLTSVKFSWEEWQQKLLKAFPEDQNYADQLVEMLNRKSRRNETSVEYYYDKIMLVNRCQLKGRQAVDCMSHGIYDYNIRMNVEGAHYSEPEDVLEYFRNISHNRNDSIAFKKVNTDHRTDSFLKSADQSHEPKNKINNENIASRKGFLSSVSCYNCGQAGHTVVRCPKEILKCKKCNRHGHLEDKCQNHKSYNLPQNRTSTDSTSKKILNITENENKNSKYYKQVAVNGKVMVGYIDFGSECTLISEDKCKELNLYLTTDSLPKLRGFGNDSITPLAKTRVRIVVDLVDVQLTAYIVPSNLLPSDILIGQSLTELTTVRVFKSDTTLTLYQIKANKCNLVVMKTANITKIKSDTIVEVNCHQNYNGFVSINTDIRINGGSEYFVLPGLYPVTNGMARLIAISLNNREVVIPKNKIFARGVGVPTVVISPEQNDAYFINVRRIQSEVCDITKDDVNVDDNLNSGLKTELLQLLNKYRDCFAFSTNELGKTSVTEMRIQLHDPTPVTYRPYRLSLAEREKVNTIINELLSNNIIRESDSEYASPIILVTKKNGELRLCIDYRALNRKTVKDKYPMPLIDDQIDNLQGQRYFTTLDLAQGYHQIPVSEDSKKLTAFVTPDGHYEYNRMPFGLSNAPAVFQRMVHSLLNKHKLPGVLAYMDDIIIGSISLEEGIDKLRSVLDIIREAHLTLNLKKCHFYKTTIEYLGFEISANGVRPGSRKTEAVASFPVPKSCHEVRQFIGLASFFRRFVCNFATLAKPLTSLTKSKAVWVWGEEQTKAFNQIKEALITRPVLIIYNPHYLTELHTDASKLGIGSVLLQKEDEKSPLKAVAYFSRQTTTEEEHLHSYELETLAVVMSLNRFRVYLLGIPFKVVTDCNALRTTLTKRDIIPRIARWWLLVQDYDFVVEYRPGTKMQHADCLSRNPLPNESNDVMELGIMNVVTEEHSVLAAQLSDPRLKLIKSVLDKNCIEAKDVRNNYCLKDGKIYRKVGSELKWVVPRDARWKICQLCHDESGHFAFEKTLEKMRRDYWFPAMAHFVRKYVRACIPCAYAKEPSGKKQGTLYPIPKPSTPFECVHIDHVGPFVRSKGGNTYILGIIDSFTKFIVLRAVRNTKSRTTIQIMREFIGLFGSPKVIVSDRGTSFTSAEFRRFIESNQIKHVKNAVATPRANGQIERYNRSILSSLTALNIDKDDRNWDSDLNKVQWSLNNTFNKGIGKTPAQVVFGKDTVNLSENHLHEISEQLTVDENIDATREQVASHIRKQQQFMKARFDKKRCTANTYRSGDLVMVLKSARNIGTSNKLIPPYSGPYRVTAVLGNDRYEVSSVDGFSTRKYKNVYSADKMKPWIRLGPILESDSGDESNSSHNDNKE